MAWIEFGGLLDASGGDLGLVQSFVVLRRLIIEIGKIGLR